MKIKELQKAVNVAWSPQDQTPILLAAGSAAQQILDTSANSSNPTLELYSLNLSDPGYDLDLVGVQQSQHKFHKIVWSPFDNAGSAQSTEHSESNICLFNVLCLIIYFMILKS